MKSRKIKIIAIILSIIAIMAVAGTVIYFLNGSEKSNTVESMTEEVTVDSSAEDLSKEYVLECKYLGGIGYPEVYEYPFKRTENYVSNKELWESHPERIEPVLEAATAFIEKVFNVNYEDIKKDKAAYVNELAALLDPDFIYYEDNATGEIKTAEDYAEVIANEIIENKYIVEAEFKSDGSLVYEDCYNTVRGVLKYKVYSSENEGIPADGEEKTVIIHIRTNMSNETPNVWYAVYGLTQEDMIYKIE